jgi:hydrogenase nickel incorporation protein HypB
MCTVCGCGAADSPHHHDHPHEQSPYPDHAHPHTHDDRPSPSHEPVHEPAEGATAGRRIRLERDLLAENDRHAAANRAFLAGRRVLSLNLLASPGAGKTTLLERTIADLAPDLPIAVVEGDQETRFDAERIEAAGGRARQINTGRMCHLDAHMVGHALADLDPEPGSLVVIENIGNLVCPAAFDLGEQAKVVLLSVTEGDDKPLKYRDMFAVAAVVLLTKTDLLPHVRFDLDRCRGFARQVNPGVDILEVSAVSGAGLERWYDWIRRQLPRPQTARAAFGE